MVHVHRLPAVVSTTCWLKNACRLAVAVLVCMTVTVSLTAQEPSVHYRHYGDMPPGAIGQQQLMRGGPLPGYYQPVKISVPDGVKISLVTAGNFGAPQNGPRQAAFLIGQVYRLKTTHIPLHAGVEVFPTIELIDRLYPPLGQEFQFPVPIQISMNDLIQAANGKMITRVVYVEDPLQALPIAEENNQQLGFDVAESDDPLLVADSLGRPIAILRMGARIPGPDGPDQRFLYGSPPWMPPRQIVAPHDLPPAEQLQFRQDQSRALGREAAR